MPPPFDYCTHIYAVKKHTQYIDIRDNYYISMSISAALALDPLPNHSFIVIFRIYSYTCNLLGLWKILVENQICARKMMNILRC